MLIFSILSVLFLVLGTINIISRVQRLKKKKILQENWGTFNSSPSASDSVKSLENNLALEKREKKYDSFIDSQTWDDLDLQKIFKKINITESSLGAECLYNRLHLHVYSQNQTIEDTKDFLNKNNDVRLELQYLFTKLGKKNNNLTNKIIKEASNYKKEKLYLYFLLGITPLLSLFLAIPFRTFGTVLFSCSFLFNIFFSLSKKYLMDLELERMSYLVQMIYIGKKISRYSFPKKNQLKNAIKEFSLLNIFGYTYKPNVEFVDMGVILEYLNFLFLIPIISHAYMVNKLKKHNLKAQSIYDILSELEAAISILNYEIALDYFCRPTFSTSKELTAKQIYHPLLTEPVANSIDFKENILIGGDNASGKSTFLRTVAVNIVLAQSINIALANEFSMQHGNIFTLIKVQDSISRGESYFMAESRIVKSILDRLNNEQNYIFLDEIFRGTNAVERIGAAIGIMQWLNNHNCLYMISTHDLNLIELAKDWNETYHFTSSFINNKIIYDYKIKSGKPQTSNAVNILKTLSYPSEVVTVAQDTIKIVNSNF